MTFIYIETFYYIPVADVWTDKALLEGPSPPLDTHAIVNSYLVNALRSETSPRVEEPDTLTVLSLSPSFHRIIYRTMSPFGLVGFVQ